MGGTLRPPTQRLGGSERRFVYMTIGFVSQKDRGGFSPLLLWSLLKAYAGSANVLVDELEARGDLWI